MSNRMGSNAAMSENLALLRKSISKLERMYSKIGTKSEDDEFRERLKDEMKEANVLSRNIMTAMSDSAKQGGNDSSMQQKFKEQFQREFSRMQRITEKINGKNNSIDQVMAENRHRADSGAMSMDDEKQLRKTLEEQHIDIQFLEYNDMEIKRRHQDILQIESDAVEVLEMYKEMQDLINQQDTSVTQLENTVESAKESVKDGYGELTKPKSSRTENNPNMGQTPSLESQIFEIKFTAKTLDRQSKKAERRRTTELKKVKKAIQEGNMDVARIYAENAIRHRNHALNLLRMSSRLDSVSQRLQSAQNMTKVTKDMAQVSHALGITMNNMKIEENLINMEKFEKNCEDLDVSLAVMENSMNLSVAPLQQETEVDGLMQQIAEENGLDLAAELTSIGVGKETRVAEEPVELKEDDDLERRMKKLMEQ